LLKKVVVTSVPHPYPSPGKKSNDVRDLSRGRGEVFREAGAEGPRLPEILHPLSAQLRLDEGNSAAERG
jgi:hypothetical protein